MLIILALALLVAVCKDPPLMVPVRTEAGHVVGARVPWLHIALWLLTILVPATVIIILEKW